MVEIYWVKAHDLGRLCRQDQLVHLRQTQSVNLSFVIYFHGAILLKQFLAADASYSERSNFITFRNGAGQLWNE